jgi:hypothetical protein
MAAAAQIPQLTCPLGFCRRQPESSVFATHFLPDDSRHGGRCVPSSSRVERPWKRSVSCHLWSTTVITLAGCRIFFCTRFLEKRRGTVAVLLSLQRGPKSVCPFRWFEKHKKTPVPMSLAISNSRSNHRSERERERVHGRGSFFFATMLSLVINCRS